MLKNWFKTFVTSIFNPRGYPELYKRSFWSGYWYLFWLFVIGLLIKIAMFSVAIMVAAPVVKKQLPAVKTQIKNAYPENLVIDIKNGEATTNVTEPYVISLRQVVPQLAGEGNPMLLVIDTQGSVEKYPTHNALFLLTKNSVAYPSRNNSNSNSYEVFPLSEIKEPVTIDKPLYDKIITQVLPFVDKVPQFMYTFAVIALVLFPFLGSFSMLLGVMIYLLIMSIILLIASKVMKRGFTYRSLFKASMYGLTVPLVLTYVVDFLRLQIPYLYNLAFLGWMICVLTLNRAPVYTKNNARSKKVSSR
jgi:hypothetical protein